MTVTLTDARDELRRVFGYQDFIGKQAEVITQVLNGGSALALMPTGGGKSLCYQIPALVLPGTTLVISPLIALMKDQVDGLLQYNIRAAYLNSTQTISESRQVRAQFLNGELDLLYVAPERLLSGDGVQFIQQQPINLIAIDEAHCISQWGHDFRPEYLKLSTLFQHLPQVPRLALTATADAQTKKEIIEKLNLENAQITVDSFDRRNIRYQIFSKENTRAQFLEFYQREHAGHSGIIYCLSRRRSEETAQWLESIGLTALPYHAGMTTKTRQRHQEKFIREEGIIICATVAFGMGIDKSDVRFVAHFDLPKSIEGYYQETGRAGRDGLAANALLFYGLGDAVNIRKLLQDSTAPANIRRIEQQKLDALITFCEANDCRRALLLKYFGEAYQVPCNNCDNCITPPQMQDGTVIAQKFLSAVMRSRQMFGVTHIVDILIGKTNEKIQKFSHETLSTFGIGSDIGASEWKRIARQLISNGLLQPDEQYGALKITEIGSKVLRGERTVTIKKEVKKTKATKADRVRKPRTDPSAVLNEWQAAIFEELRAERLQLAQAQNVPAYTVFHDSTLIELAKALPTTEAEFATIPGIGAGKSERYAAKFLKIIDRLREAE